MSKEQRSKEAERAPQEEVGIYYLPSLGKSVKAKNYQDALNKAKEYKNE